MDAEKLKDLGLRPIKTQTGPVTFRFEMNEEQSSEWHKFQAEMKALGMEAGPQAVGQVALRRYMAEVRAASKKDSKGGVA